MPEYEVVFAMAVREYLRELPADERSTIVECLYRELPLKDDQVIYLHEPQNCRMRPLGAGYAIVFRPLEAAERDRCRIDNGYFVMDLRPIWRGYPD
ncbi:MAG: hypothetical protein JWP48_5389 [Actinoallomurus sp.]|jgi:hypothetical protein|nr:hypothetical protein [Actinoallomurus sp.]